MSNIQDEFKVFKDELKKLNIDVQKVVKVGNGSMDFHEVFYKSPRYQEVKSVYVAIIWIAWWRNLKRLTIKI
jgi:hypothetical protein